VVTFCKAKFRNFFRKIVLSVRLKAILFGGR
jgi:hypothetical protein